MAAIITCIDCGSFIDRTPSGDIHCDKCDRHFCRFHGPSQKKECDLCRNEEEAQMQHWMTSIDQDALDQDYIDRESGGREALNMNLTLMALSLLDQEKR